MDKYPEDCKLDKCMIDMCPEDCHFLMKCAVELSDGTWDKTKCKEELANLP